MRRLNRVFRVRYKEGPHFRSRLFFTDSPDGLADKVPGKVLKVEKFSYERLYHVGSGNQLPRKLMNEFRKGGNNGHITFSLNQKEINQEVVNERRKQDTRNRRKEEAAYNSGDA